MPDDFGPIKREDVFKSGPKRPKNSCQEHKDERLNPFDPGLPLEEIDQQDQG